MLNNDVLLAALKFTGSPVTVADVNTPDAPIVFCNKAFLDLTGYDEGEVIGRNCRFLQGPDTDAAAIHRLGSSIAHGTESIETILNYKKDGTAFWNDLLVSPIKDDSGRVTHYVGFQTDISERLEKERANDLVQRIEDELGFKDDIEKISKQIKIQTLDVVRVLEHLLDNNSHGNTNDITEKIKHLEDLANSLPVK